YFFAVFVTDAFAQSLESIDERIAHFVPARGPESKTDRFADFPRIAVVNSLDERVHRSPGWRTDVAQRGRGSVADDRLRTVQRLADRVDGFDRIGIRLPG